MSEATRHLSRGDAEDKVSILKMLRRWFSPQSGEAETVRDVIEELIDERNEEIPRDGGPVINPNERLLLANVLNMRMVTAADIMVPRPDIVAVEVETKMPDVLGLLMKERHSRLPVYRGTLDDVIGMVHIKDAAVIVAAPDIEHPPLSKIMRPLLFISPAVRVLDLLLEMRLKRTHMALVVDESGGIDGLLTIEDVVEQIVGKIDDEHDVDEALRIIEKADGSISVDARVTLEELEKRFGDIFTAEEYAATDTLGGLVISLAGHVPGRGELIKHPSGIEFEVIDGDLRRVRQLRVRGLLATALPDNSG
jgi:magnesium and cobalt transporter